MLREMYKIFFTGYKILGWQIFFLFTFQRCNSLAPKVSDERLVVSVIVTILKRNELTAFLAGFKLFSCFCFKQFIIMFLNMNILLGVYRAS